jgi:hypothetical protein
MALVLLKAAAEVHCPVMKMKFLTGAALKQLLSIALTALAALGAQQAEAQILEWATSYNGIPTSALEETEGVVVDASGNVFATGLSGNGTGSAICTMRLTPSGTIQWTIVETKASLCGGMWGRTPLVQDAAGNLIVVGAEYTSNLSSWNPLLLTYTPGGATLLRRVYDLGPFASFDAVAVDASGLYVLAHNNPNNGNPHIVQTLKLSPTGDILWNASFTPGTFWGTRGGIVVTSSGAYTAVAGKVTMRDLTTGTILWEKDITMSNGGSPLAADGAGNIYLTPYQNGVTKCDPAGNVLHVYGAISSLVSDVDVDTAGNIYIAGSTVSSKSGSDILTQKYGPAGNLVWSTTYGKSGQYSDNGIAITVRGGYVYVGASKFNKNLDMCTLKYRAGN